MQPKVKGKVLVIDDEKIFREIMVEMLQKENFKVFQADEGQSGIATAKKEHFDLIILDIYMPGLSGFDTLLALRKFVSDVPVIMVTAKDSTQNYREAMRIGAHDYLVKPIKKDKLMRIMNAIFEKKEITKDESDWFTSLERLKKGTASLKQQLTGKKIEFFAKEFAAFLDSIVLTIAEVLQVKTVSIMTINHKKQKLILKATYGLNRNLVQNATKPLGSGISGWVAQSGEALLIKDLNTDKKFSESHFSFQYDSPSLICVPINVDGRVEGVINVNNKENGEPFDEKDLTLLQMFATNVEFAMKHRKLYRRLDNRLKELTLLYQITSRITSTLDFDELVDDLLQNIHDAFSVQASSIILLNEEKKTLYFKATIGKQQGIIKRFELKIGEGIAGWVVKHKKSVISNDLQNDPRFSSKIDEYSGFKSLSTLCIPLVLAGNAMGAIEILNKKNRAPFKKRDLMLLEAIASQTVLVLKNAYLHSTLSQKINEAIATQKRETQLKKILQNKIDEIEKLKKNSFITFRIEDED